MAFPEQGVGSITDYLARGGAPKSDRELRVEAYKEQKEKDVSLFREHLTDIKLVKEGKPAI